MIARNLKIIMADPELIPEHHKQAEIAYNRPDYREARWERAVKVYTVNQESRYLLVQNVHALGVTKDLMELFSLYGDIEEYRLLDEYPAEPYTDVYWVKFVSIDSARVAKRKLDNRSFFGKNLHICYAPEFETVQDTREKLQQRRKIIAKKTRDTFERFRQEQQAMKQKEAQTNVGEPSSVQSQLATLNIPSHGSEGQTQQWSHDHSLQSHDYQVQSHDHQLQQSLDYHLPGLPPLPQLPFPPTPHAQEGIAYPSSVCGKDGKVHFVIGGLSRGGGGSPQQPVQRTHGGSSGKTLCTAGGRGGNYKRPRLDDGTSEPGHNPSGLTKSDRVVLYLESTGDNSKGKLPHTKDSTELVAKPKRSKLSDSGAKPVSGRGDSCAISSQSKTAAVTKIVTMKESAALLRPSHTHPALHPVHPPPLETGNRSVNSSVQSVREYMSKVWNTPAAPPMEPAKPKPKKRKRI